MSLTARSDTKKQEQRNYIIARELDIPGHQKPGNKFEQHCLVEFSIDKYSQIMWHKSSANGAACFFPY